jgi:hypothetical protein
VSRRKRRPGAPATVSAAGTAAEAAPGEARPAEPLPWRRVLADVAVLAAIFAVSVGIAEIAGAANLGVALGVGQVVFAIALVVVALRA